MVTMFPNISTTRANTKSISARSAISSFYDTILLTEKTKHLQFSTDVENYDNITDSRLYKIINNLL